MHIYPTSRAADDFLTVVEAADQLAVHPSTIRRWIDQGRLPAYRVGARRLAVKVSDLSKVVVARPARRVAEVAPGYEVAIPRLTDEQRERGLRALENLNRFGAELLAKYGRFPQEGWELLNDSRDERNRELAGE